MHKNRDDDSRMKSRQSATAGFSLLELMIVVAIILVVGAFALPTVTTNLRSYRLINDARSLIGEINIARLRAASIGGRTEVICDTLTTGSTALTCGIAVRRLGDSTFHGFLPAAYQIAHPVLDIPTQIRLTGTDSFGFPSGATTGAGLSGVNGQNGVTPFNCNAVVFNSRGLPIFDSTANIQTAGTPNTCATVNFGISGVTPPSDGTRKYNYVMYLQSGQSTFLSVVIDSSGSPSLWQWSGTSSTWILLTD
jgi:prepilin-type N-terminal cleavage/methylation domain-containing protein